jgi:hypothetical protein
MITTIFHVFTNLVVFISCFLPANDFKGMDLRMQEKRISLYFLLTNPPLSRIENNFTRLMLIIYF